MSFGTRADSLRGAGPDRSYACRAVKQAGVYFLPERPIHGVVRIVRTSEVDNVVALGHDVRCSDRCLHFRRVFRGVYRGAHILHSPRDDLGQTKSCCKSRRNFVSWEKLDRRLLFMPAVAKTR
nr:hypothetical protein CFP56_62163 [Quercus suber]